MVELQKEIEVEQDALKMELELINELNRMLEASRDKAEAERDALMSLLEPLYQAVKPYSDKICPHGNTTKYPVHGWWCDECWNPVIEYFEQREREATRKEGE